MIWCVLHRVYAHSRQSNVKTTEGHSGSTRTKRGANNSLRFHLNLRKMFFTFETFRVNLVNFLSSRTTRRKPSTFRTTFKPPMETPSPGALVGLTGQGGPIDTFSGDPFERSLLKAGRRRFYPIKKRVTIREAGFI